MKNKIEMPVTTMQSYFWNYQTASPDSTIYNLSYLLKFGEGIEANKLAAALTQTLRHQESVQTILFQTIEGIKMQRFAPELTQTVTVEQIAGDELEKLRKSLVQPFCLEGRPLYRCRVFQTEEAVYGFLDIHHIIFDGWAGMIFWKNVEAAYHGHHLQSDHYYESLEEQQRQKDSVLYRQAKQYFEAVYGNLKKQDTLLRTDEPQKVKFQRIFINEPLTLDQKRLREYEKKHHIDHSIFFLTVTAMAAGLYNGTDKLYFTWTYHGRDSREAMKSTGMFIQDLPIKIDLNFGDDITVLYEDLIHQIAQGIRYQCYSYTLLDEDCARIDQLCYIYQGSMGDVTSFCGYPTENIRLENPQNEPENIMDVRMESNAGEIYLVTDCDPAWYREESIRKYRRIFEETAQKLLEDSGA